VRTGEMPVGLIRKSNAKYDIPEIIKGIVRSERLFISIVWIIFNFSNIKTPAIGSSRVKTTTRDNNQNFRLAGKTMV
jgi:hypothetical protein